MAVEPGVARAGADRIYDMAEWIGTPTASHFPCTCTWPSGHAGATAAPVIKLPAARTAGYPGHALYFDGALTGAKSVVNLDLPATGPTSEFTVSAW